MFEIIYRPELGEDGDIYPIRFPSQVQPKGDRQEITIDGPWISPGRNSNITPQQWEYIMSTELGQAMETAGILQKINADKDAVLEDGLQGYSSTQAIRLVKYTNDIDNLELERVRERRPEVLTAIANQIKKIQKVLDRQRNTSLIEKVY